MKAELVNIFVQAATTVFEKELNISLSRHAAVRKSKPVPGRPVCIVLGLAGSVRGQVVYAVDDSFAMDIAHHMIPNTLPSKLRQLMGSAVGEMGNMITGQATIALAGEEKSIEITPPTVITGDNILVNFVELPTVSLQMLSEMGVLEINIAIEGA